MVKLPLVLLLLGASLPARQKLVTWTTAKVVSQDISTTEEGVAARKGDHVFVARKLNLLHNFIVLENGTDILFLREVFDKDHYLVLEINGTTRYYMDKDWFIIADSRDKEHRFSLTGMKKIE